MTETRLPSSAEPHPSPRVGLVATVIRKLRKSIDQRGAVRTAIRIAIFPLKLVRTLVRSWMPSRRRYKRAEIEFDRRFHLDTCKDLDVNWIAAIDSENWKFGYGYAPVPLSGVSETVPQLAIRYQDFTFIDFGSGKGRSLFLAAEFPFAAISGVEFSQRLHTIACTNIQSYQNPAQKCVNLRAVYGDAAEFPIPDGPTVCFFNNPFDVPVLRRVIANIVDSYLQSPRQLFVVYYLPLAAEAIADEFQNTVFRERIRAKNYFIFETPECAADSAPISVALK